MARNGPLWRRERIDGREYLPSAIQVVCSQPEKCNLVLAQDAIRTTGFATTSSIVEDKRRPGSFLLSLGPQQRESLRRILDHQ